jgi:hypothetical protein
MHNILLFNPDFRPFEFVVIKRIVQSATGFRDVRLNEPGGDVLEAQYAEPDDWTFVGLSGDRETISLSGTSDAALRAALILQQNIGTPLSMVDTEYSFDLTFYDLSNVEQLRAAIEQARTS